jgi:diaminohydroxyphosphoribosylaminopyrimidine deaminase/5-amino-6-(5-phosphoribosylamino)uracil reductase
VILTGSGTVLADDPSLNVRLEGASRQPLRVVLDSRLRVPPSARIFGIEGKSMVFTMSDDPQPCEALREVGVDVERLPAAGSGGGAGMDLPAMCARLAAHAANEVWVESGPRLAGALLAARLVDELVIYLAPCLLGPDAQPLAELPPLRDLSARLQLQYLSAEFIGPDLRIIARPVNPG